MDIKLSELLPDSKFSNELHEIPPHELGVENLHDIEAAFKAAHPIGPHGRGKTRFLKKADEYALIAAWQDHGDRSARDKVIRVNDPFCHYMVRKYGSAYLVTEYEDLLQQARMGLCTAIDKFDRSKNLLFLTYAGWWVRSYISGYILQQGHEIYLPLKKQEEKSKLYAASEQILRQTGRKATDSELAKQLQMNVQEVRDIFNYRHNTISLNTPVNDDEDSASFGDFIEDQSTLTPHGYAEKLSQLQELQRFLNHPSITANEREVIEAKYLNDDGELKTLEQVGHLMGLTRERIRQLEVSALAKLTRLGNAKPPINQKPRIAQGVTTPDQGTKSMIRIIGDYAVCTSSNLRAHFKLCHAWILDNRKPLLVGTLKGDIQGALLHFSDADKIIRDSLLRRTEFSVSNLVSDFKKVSEAMNADTVAILTKHGSPQLAFIPKTLVRRIFGNIAPQIE